MYCDQCGGQLQAGVANCSRCGKGVVGTVELRRGRVREHVRLVGILWMAYSALHVLVGFAAIIVAETLFNTSFHIQGGPPPEVAVWLRPVINVVGVLILAKAAAGFIAGWGLLKHQDWARTVALVVGFVTLLSVPVGTALSIYTLWVLLPSQSDEEYKVLAQAA
jgi:hypothetical protein